ncbi:tRNA1(Val) (adenine(37)-N6)-methyltransferase [Anaeroarcus burkinensis]|uniref:tRNA1(Val) (adenine(37)-N6)-methyltransferase n=1 Tax=Anaeroarcus burkinensis TaxID=82376 RepID=UPI00041D5927|nr:methyltransferase [Anaeroarcus burkinensis]
MIGVRLCRSERVDDLGLGGLRIIQHPRSFCFSLDAVLLAHFVRLRPQDKVVDLGAGNGAISLLLAARGARTVAAVELDKAAASRAARSIQLSRRSGQIQVYCGDYRQKLPQMPGGIWDIVVANPPYFQPERGKGSVEKGLARQEVTATLADVLKAARRLVRFRGRVALVHRADRMVDVLTAMREANLEPKRLQLVQPRGAAPANLLLIEGVHGGKPGLEVLAPLAVYEADGSYTAQLRACYETAPTQI